MGFRPCKGSNDGLCWVWHLRLCSCGLKVVTQTHSPIVWPRLQCMKLAKWTFFLFSEHENNLLFCPLTDNIWMAKGTHSLPSIEWHHSVSLSSGWNEKTVAPCVSLLSSLFPYGASIRGAPSRIVFLPLYAVLSSVQKYRSPIVNSNSLKMHSHPPQGFPHPLHKRFLEKESVYCA